MKSEMAEVLISDDETPEERRAADATDLSSAEEENTLQEYTEETQHTPHAGHSLTDEDDDDEGQQDSWSPEEAAQAFIANVTIVQPHTHTHVQKEEETRQYEQKIHTPEHTHTPPLWMQEILKDEGVLAEGVSRLRFRSLQPVCVNALQKREVCVHRHYVRESLHLFLLYFLQLSVMATYTHQQTLRLVPLLTVIFVFGRLIYWVCVAFGSSVRALGFSLSFLPLLVLLGANLYFIGSGSGKEAVFDVAPPTTAPPPKQRWWG